MAGRHERTRLEVVATVITLILSIVTSAAVVLMALRYLGYI